MVLSMIYYIHNEGSVMNRIAIKIGQNRLAMALVAADAACWGRFCSSVFTFSLALRHKGGITCV